MTTLIADEDSAARNTLSALLGSEGFRPLTAGSGAECIRTVIRESPDVLVVNLRLPDMTGLDIVRRLRGDGLQVPFVLTGAFADIGVVVEAMRLGAADVLPCPVDPDRLVSILRRVRPGRRSSQATPSPTRMGEALAALAGGVERNGARHSNAERWALCVLRVAEAVDDPKTLSAWARCVGTSYTSLRDLCYVLGMSPRRARDFARGARVVAWLSTGEAPLATLVNAASRRSLDEFCRRAGLPVAAGSLAAMLRLYVAVQQFVPPTNPGVVAMRRALE